MRPTTDDRQKSLDHLGRVSFGDDQRGRAVDFLAQALSSRAGQELVRVSVAHHEQLTSRLTNASTQPLEFGRRRPCIAEDYDERGGS